MATMSVLKVDNLSQSYGGLKILQDVSFGLEAGERVGLIGPNGAGKTVLLNCINGLYRLFNSKPEILLIIFSLNEVLGEFLHSA